MIGLAVGEAEVVLEGVLATVLEEVIHPAVAVELDIVVEEVVTVAEEVVTVVEEVTPPTVAEEAAEMICLTALTAAEEVTAAVVAISLLIVKRENHSRSILLWVFQYLAYYHDIMSTEKRYVNIEACHLPCVLTLPAKSSPPDAKPASRHSRTFSEFPPC